MFFPSLQAQVRPSIPPHPSHGWGFRSCFGKTLPEFSGIFSTNFCCLQWRLVPEPLQKHQPRGTKRSVSASILFVVLRCCLGA